MKVKHNRLLIRLIAIAALTLMSMPVDASPAWEKVDARRTEMADVVENDVVEVEVRDGSIYLTLGNRTEVKVFTILGQLVAHQKLEGGTWRLTLPARGIYILKAGSVTRRITI